MLIEKFQEYVARHELFTRQDKILLTVSGGVDSMVLMSLCVNSGYTVGVAHCNFSLRGKESDEDEILVQERARKYGIECHNHRFDTLAEMERTGESMEMAARRLRYAWFNELCEQHGYTVIAVAHHIDDLLHQPAAWHRSARSDGHTQAGGTSREATALRHPQADYGVRHTKTYPLP